MEEKDAGEAGPRGSTAPDNQQAHPLFTGKKQQQHKQRKKKKTKKEESKVGPLFAQSEARIRATDLREGQWAHRGRFERREKRKRRTLPLA